MNSSLYSALVHAHSIGRWAMLILLVIAIFNSAVAGGRPFIKSDNRTGLFLIIFTDLMLLIGVALWYFGPRGYEMIKNSGNMSNVMHDATTRFYTIEHAVGMLIAIILIHVGKAQAKKTISDNAKHRRTVLYYLLALLIIIFTIPWPFREIGVGRGWF